MLLDDSFSDCLDEICVLTEEIRIEFREDDGNSEHLQGGAVRKTMRSIRKILLEQCRKHPIPKKERGGNKINIDSKEQRLFRSFEWMKNDRPGVCTCKTALIATSICCVKLKRLPLNLTTTSTSVDLASRAREGPSQRRSSWSAC